MAVAVASPLRRASSADERRSIEESARTALSQYEPLLKEQMTNWPVECCGDTCHQIFRPLQDLLRGKCDLRSLWVRDGWFDTVEASGNDPASPYGNHWGRGHVWIEWRDVIIDPTASQFLSYLPTPLLIATPEMPEHSFYFRNRRDLP
jgi:hypothetical protein